METQFTKKEFDIRRVKVNEIHMRLTSIILTLVLAGSVTNQLFGQNSDVQNGQVAPELVGKWCYMDISSSTTDAISNSCITLNADGSFDAVLDRKMLPNANAFGNLQDSDYGKWWVNGNQIFYNSPTNGQGSFSFQKINHPRLENTPLIMINGVAFATASSHDPW
jgi:hypothetical protein